MRRLKENGFFFALSVFSLILLCILSCKSSNEANDTGNTGLIWAKQQIRIFRPIPSL